MSGAAAALRALAEECRRLAVDGTMASVATALSEMAFDYDRQADRIEKAEARAREGLANRPPLDGG